MLFLNIMRPLKEVHRILDEAFETSLQVNVLMNMLHQPVDQPASSSDHMQTALVLVLFQDLVQTAFQLIHTAPPQLGSNYLDNKNLLKLLRPLTAHR